MTFFHCVNCLILAFAPFVVYYKASGLASEQQYWILIKSGLGFLMTSIIKLALTATLANVSNDVQLSIWNEMLYSCTSLIDAMGLAYLINAYKIDIMRRVEFVALGWSAAEVLASKLMPLLFYSRSPEVDYKWIQFSLDSTCDLLFTLSFTLSCWLALCAKGKMAPSQSNFMFFGIHVILPGLLNYVKNTEVLSGWVYVGVHFIVSLALLIIGKKMLSAKYEVLKA